MQDAVHYLTGTVGSPMYFRLMDLLSQSKQARAPASQWLATIKAFSQKGLKQIELDDSRLKLGDEGFMAWLGAKDPAQPLTREELLEEVSMRYFTVKEVVLGAPKYPRYRQPGGQYLEYLYIANSEKANVEDALEEIQFELEELAIHPERIAEDPLHVVKLTTRRAELMSQMDTAIDFRRHHYDDKISGKLGRNLLVHARVSIRGDTYFIEEIQSDWAQLLGGRKSGQHGKAPEDIPVGPLVTSTEAWAGMALRRHMQLAAQMPGIKRIAWITESMRNGGRQDLQKEREDNERRKAYAAAIDEIVKAKLAELGADKMSREQQAAARELAREHAERIASSRGIKPPEDDNLNEFYVAMLPKIADKIISKAGARTTRQQLTLDEKLVPVGAYGSGSTDGRNVVEVPCIEITPAVRDVLAAPQPVYSRAPLRRTMLPLEHLDEQRAQALRLAREMCGSVRHLQFANHVFDIATGREVAGRFVNDIALVSLHARDIPRAAQHECVHWAVEKLLTPVEVRMLREEFADGTELNFRVRHALTRADEPDAARQCSDPIEAAAHGFTLWQRGQISVTEPPIQGLFSDFASLMKQAVRWFRRVVLDQRATSVEELFEKLARGELAASEAQRSANASPVPAMPDRAAAVPGGADRNPLHRHPG